MRPYCRARLPWFHGLLAERLLRPCPCCPLTLPAGTATPRALPLTIPHNPRPQPRIASHRIASKSCCSTPRSAAICSALTLGSKIASWAPLSSRLRQMRMAGVSRVSLMSALWTQSARGHTRNPARRSRRLPQSGCVCPSRCQRAAAPPAVRCGAAARWRLPHAGRSGRREPPG